MIYNPSIWYWTVGDQSPATQVYCGATGTYVPLSDPTYIAWVAAGGAASPVDTMANLVMVLRDANIPPYHKVRKSTVIARLTDAQLSAALGMLTQRQMERWRAPDQPAVNADDPDTLAVLKAIGASAAVILAVE